MSWAGISRRLPYEAVDEHLGALPGAARRAAGHLGVAGRDGIEPSDLDRVARALASADPAALPAPTPEQVRTLRATLGIGAAAFGALLHVHHRTVARWEEGERAIPANLRAAFYALIPEPTRRTHPEQGETVTLHAMAVGEHLAVAGDLALAVRTGQLSASLTPPATLVLDKALPWQPAPAALPIPLATYNVERAGPYTLTLVCPDIAPIERLPDTPPVNYRAYDLTRIKPKTPAAATPPAKETPVPQISFIEPRTIPAPAPRQALNRACSEARGHLEHARTSGRAIRLTFGADERSSAAYARYRAQAKKIGLAVRVTVGEWRPYTSKTGKTNSEPAVFYVTVEAPHGQPAPEPELAMAGSARNGRAGS